MQEEIVTRRLGGDLRIEVDGSWANPKVRLTDADGADLRTEIFSQWPVVQGGAQFSDYAGNPGPLYPTVYVDDPRVIAAYGRFLLDFVNWFHSVDFARVGDNAWFDSKRISYHGAIPVPTDEEIEEVYGRLGIPRQFDNTRGWEAYHELSDRLHMPFAGYVADWAGYVAGYAQKAEEEKGKLLHLIDGRLVRQSDIPESQFRLVANPQFCLHNALAVDGNKLGEDGKWRWEGVADATEAIQTAEKIFADPRIYLEEDVSESEELARLRKQIEGDAYVPSKELASKPTWPWFEKTPPKIDNQ